MHPFSYDETNAFVENSRTRGNMSDFFSGHRRRIGLALLILALVFAGGWVRSLSNNDELNIWSGHLTIHSFNSSPTGICWMQRSNLSPNIGMFSGKFGRVAFQ